jgi:quinol monooxygenase YgiN
VVPARGLCEQDAAGPDSEDFEATRRRIAGRWHYPFACDLLRRIFYLHENWESVDTHEAHMQAPHLQHFASIVDDLVDGGLAVVRLSRIA